MRDWNWSSQSLSRLCLRVSRTARKTAKFYVDGAHCSLSSLDSPPSSPPPSAIGSAILQAYAYIISDRSSNLPLLSLCSSVCTIAYHVSTISYDFDVSPEFRAKDEWFYGFVSALCSICKTKCLFHTSLTADISPPSSPPFTSLLRCRMTKVQRISSSFPWSQHRRAISP